MNHLKRLKFISIFRTIKATLNSIWLRMIRFFGLSLTSENLDERTERDDRETSIQCNIYRYLILLNQCPWVSYIVLRIMRNLRTTICQIFAKTFATSDMIEMMMFDRTYRMCRNYRVFSRSQIKHDCLKIRKLKSRTRWV